MGPQFSWALWLRVCHEATTKLLAGLQASPDSSGGRATSKSPVDVGTVQFFMHCWTEGFNSLLALARGCPQSLSCGSLHRATPQKAGSLGESRLEELGAKGQAGEDQWDHLREAAYTQSLLFV